MLLRGVIDNKGIQDSPVWRVQHRWSEWSDLLLLDVKLIFNFRAHTLQIFCFVRHFVLPLDTVEWFPFFSVLNFFCLLELTILALINACFKRKLGNGRDIGFVVAKLFLAKLTVAWIFGCHCRVLSFLRFEGFLLMLLLPNVNCVLSMMLLKISCVHEALGL